MVLVHFKQKISHCVVCTYDTKTLQQNRVKKKIPIGIHALVFSGTWDRQGAERAIYGAQANGFDLIEIPLLDPSAVDSKMTKQLLDEYGINGTASLGLNPDADISSDDMVVAAAGEALLMDALKVASSFGSEYLCGVLYSALAKYPGPVSFQGRLNAINALRRVASAAKNDFGMKLCLEVVNRYETNVINTASAAIDLLSDIGSDNIKLHLDSYHMNIEENSMEEAIVCAKEHLGYFHMGESHRGYLGTGSVDFDGVFAALHKLEYDGPIVFESFSSEVISPSLSNTLCIWRNLWSDSDDLASHAKKFIDGYLGSRELNCQHGS